MSCCIILKRGRYVLKMDKKELKDMTDAELLAELKSLNEEVDDMFVEDEEDK